jgi:hypothetical protein
MTNAPVIIAETLQQGASSAEEVAAALMRRVLPQHAWPPMSSQDPGWGQWRDLVRITAEHLHLPEQPQVNAFALCKDPACRPTYSRSRPTT